MPCGGSELRGSRDGPFSHTTCHITTSAATTAATKTTTTAAVGVGSIPSYPSHRINSVSAIKIKDKSPKKVSKFFSKISINVSNLLILSFHDAFDSDGFGSGNILSLCVCLLLRCLSNSALLFPSLSYVLLLHNLPLCPSSQFPEYLTKDDKIAPYCADAAASVAGAGADAGASTAVCEVVLHLSESVLSTYDVFSFQAPNVTAAGAAVEGEGNSNGQRSCQARGAEGKMCADGTVTEIGTETETGIRSETEIGAGTGMTSGTGTGTGGAGAGVNKSSGLFREKAIIDRKPKFRKISVERGKGEFQRSAAALVLCSAEFVVLHCTALYIAPLCTTVLNCIALLGILQRKRVTRRAVYLATWLCL